MIIKNMRVCINKEICRVTAYHEIDEISLVIATKGDDKVYGKKRDADNEKLDEIGKCKHYLEAVVVALQSLINHKNYTLESLEWDIDMLTSSDFEDISKFLKSRLNRVKLRVKKLVFNHNSPKLFEKDVHQFCDKKYLKAIDKRSVVPLANSADPVFVMDRYYFNYLSGITLRYSRINMKKENFENTVLGLVRFLQFEKPGFYVTLRAPHEDPEKMFNLCKSPRQPFNNHFLKVELIKNVVLRHNLSTCGYWVTAVRVSDLPRVNWNSETCGLGEFCSKCSSSFEHYYFYNLPRRIVEEPDWLNVYSWVMGNKTRDQCLADLAELVKKTPTLQARSAVDGFKGHKVNLIDNPALSMTHTLFIWTLITAIITSAFYYFYPDLLNPYLLPIPILLIPSVKFLLIQYQSVSEAIPIGSFSVS